ncbi:zinc knuckle CX2CX4HX4C containing protein [Tanacetum coccineum]
MEECKEGFPDVYECNIDVAATFGVPLTTVGDLQKLINDIDAGKHDELLSELTNEDRMETLEALGSICNSIKVDRNNADVIPCKVSYADDSINLNVDESTIPSGSAKDQPNINSNFRTLVADPVFDGVNISIPRKVVEKRLVLEGGPWLIRKSPIILKKWSMDTRLLKEELTRIPIWVKLHDVPIQVFEEMTNDGFQTVGKKKKRKGKSKSTNGGQFTGPSVKHNVRYEPKATTSAPMKGTTYVGYTSQSTPMLKTAGNSSKKDNLSMSNSFSALNEEEEGDEEEVENVYDESANLIQNTKVDGSSSFTATAG